MGKGDKVKTFRFALPVLVLAAAACAQTAPFGQNFNQGGISGFVMVIAPPNFGGLQGPSTATVCASSSDVRAHYYFTLTYEAESGAVRKSDELQKSSAPDKYPDCGLVIVPGIKRILSISVLAHQPEQAVVIDLSAAAPAVRQ
jgi:hypothetical protein